jgi:serine/threonine-protein kinase
VTLPLHETILVNRFRARAQIGHATLGWLYRAVDERSGREVALRFVLGARDPHATQARLAALIDKLARVRHPGLAAVHDCGLFANQLWFASEWVAGQALEAVITRAGALPSPEVARIGIAVAETLAAAHAQGLVHRGLTLRNLFVDGARTLTLELGVAATILDDAPCLGNTPASMAPEQARNGRVDPRSDVYSLGCCLFTAAVGRRPFEGQARLEVAAAQAGWRAPRARDLDPAVPEALELVLLRAMATRPDDRFQSMAELAAALEQACRRP